MSNSVYQQFSPQNDDNLQGRYLLLKIDEEYYGINAESVNEIIGLEQIIEIPENPKYVRGIINSRGNIITVIDLRMRLKNQVKDYSDRTCIIIVKVDDFTVGLIADNILNITNIDDSCIKRGKSKDKFLKGVADNDDKVIHILDCSHIS